MRRMWLAAMAVLALAGQAHGAVNLVQNGSFTQNTLPALGNHPGTGQAYVGAEISSHYIYHNAVTNWSSPSSANGQDYNLYFLNGNTATLGDAASRYPGEQQRPNSNFGGSSPDGGAFMVLDADPGFNGRFEQMVNGLTAGRQYELSFYYAIGELSNRTGYISAQLTGNFGASAFATPTYFNSHPVNPVTLQAQPGSNLPGDFFGWYQASYTFTATSGSQLLSFLAVGSPAANLPPVAFLDGVSLTAVPEPEVWAMMLMGFAGLGVAVRRRRALAAA